MRYLSFEKAGRAMLGVRLDDVVVDLESAVSGAPKTMLDLIQAPATVLRKVEIAAREAPTASRIPVCEIKWLPPVLNPPKIACVGLNYADHRAEAGEAKAKPEFPGMFHKVASSLVGHQRAIHVPRNSVQLDFEGELAVVIGKRAHRVAASEALDHVFGYTILDDGSIRDFQVGRALAAGKNFDASGSVGPEVVTADELPPGGAGLKLETRLNGEVMQSSNTGLLIFNVAEIISLLSHIHALVPGDLIATGTCAGVGGGRTPPVWMKAGDVLEIEIEKIGILKNEITLEP